MHSPFLLLYLLLSSRPLKWEAKSFESSIIARSSAASRAALKQASTDSHSPHNLKAREGGELEFHPPLSIPLLRPFVRLPRRLLNG